MTTQTWVSGVVGDWFTPANWTTDTVPVALDTAMIGSGNPTIGQGSSILGQTIVLGGSATASSVTLTAIDSSFGQSTGTPSFATRLFATGGHPVTSPLRATFLVQGNTSFEGQIIVSAMGGSLTIESQSDGVNPGNFTLLNTDSSTVVLVSQESFLSFTGETITNGGLIQVDGGMDIAASVTVAGSGLIVLEDGGQLAVEGTVGSGQQVIFADGTGSVTLANVATFDGVFGFTSVGGNTIDLQGVVAQSDGFLTIPTPPNVLYLALYSGPNQTGSIVATLAVEMIDEESLFPEGNTLTPEDFTLSSDGKGGTVVTYTPQAPIILEQSLPVAVVGSPGETVSLSTILMQSFGTTTPNFTNITLLPTEVAHNSKGDDAFWATPNVTSQWKVNGQVITQDYTVAAGDTVELIVGNQIIWPAQFKAQTTPTVSATSGEYVVYDVWSVDPRIAAAVEAAGYTGLPTPDAIVASANAFASVYGLVPNTNLCNWIADNVAAGAGASMPLPNAFLDPTDNQPGGFWRITYSGAQPSPVVDWSSEVAAGTIVRMGWFHPEDPQAAAVTGHTTTVLGPGTTPGTISVYDNIDFVDDVEYIGVHDASYWVSTNPADITVYQLDPAQQYLILGTSIAEQIQGSVFNDLIQSNGGADSIMGGPGNNEIQGTTAELAGIAVSDFDAGDLLDFTDLALATASVSFANGSLHVFSDHQEVATIAMPTPELGSFFFVASDGDVGTNVGLVDPVTQIERLYVGYLGRAGDPLGTGFWQNQLLAGPDTQATLKAIASSFAAQPETGAAYPFLANPQHATAAEITAFITAQYQEQFGRAPDAPGLAYWQSYLTANLASPQAVGLFPLLLAYGAMNSEAGLDLTAIANKATVGAYLSEQFAAADIDFDSTPSPANAFAHQILEQVDSTQDSVTAAEAAVLAFIQDQTELVGIAL
ncbi:MAG: hypothetical protein AB7U95_34350 [Reyranella sp.]